MTGGDDKSLQATAAASWLGGFLKWWLPLVSTREEARVVLRLGLFLESQTRGRLLQPCQQFCEPPNTLSFIFLSLNGLEWVPLSATDPWLIPEAPPLNEDPRDTCEARRGRRRALAQLQGRTLGSAYVAYKPHVQRAETRRVFRTCFCSRPYPFVVSIIQEDWRTFPRLLPWRRGDWEANVDGADSKPVPRTDPSPFLRE